MLTQFVLGLISGSSAFMAVNAAVWGQQQVFGPGIVAATVAAIAANIHRVVSR